MKIKRDTGKYPSMPNAEMLNQSDMSGKKLTMHDKDHSILSQNPPVMDTGKHTEESEYFTSDTRPTQSGPKKESKFATNLDLNPVIC